MRGGVLRRSGLDLVGDAIDRLREDWIAVVLLHVLPSAPFLLAATGEAIGIDLRGALPQEGLTGLALLFLVKPCGWAALSAWAGAGARGRPMGAFAAWRRVLGRLPEVVLAGALACLAFLAGSFTLVGFILLAPPLVGLAAALAGDGAGGWTLLRRGLPALGGDLDRSGAILFTGLVAAAVLFVNLMVLLPVSVALGAGGLGLDLELAGSAFGLTRFATWVFVASLSSLVVEAFVVAAFAELEADREREREGVRFEQFAAELEARADAAPKVATETVVRPEAARGTTAAGTGA